MDNIGSLRDLIVELHSNGIRVSPGHGFGRQGGAGPANGNVLDFGEYQVNVPTTGACTANSPYSIKNLDNQFVIKKGDIPVREVQLAKTPHYYSLHTKEGIPYWKIALLHGRDCLASTVIQTCIRWNTPDQCKFCSIGTTLSNNQTTSVKTPDQLAAVAAAAQLDGVKHVTLTSGSTAKPDDGIRYLGRCAAAIKQRTGLPVHVQFEPALDMNLYYELREAGVDTVGIHVESFDQAVREKITPGKAKVSINKYFEAFAKAVEVFGKNQVSTYLIIGLGEERDVTINGCKKCIALGVYPYVVPFRVVKGSLLENSSPPGRQILTNICNEVSQLLAAHDLSWKKSKAGCVRCGACSALPAYEGGS